jgi:hypothetical protein
MNRSLLRYAKPLFTAFAIAVCSFFWLKGFLGSPLWLPEIKKEYDFLRSYIANNSIDYSLEIRLAEAYWLRYRDVRNDPYWGENGPQNIWGPRDHFRQHGRKEGRIFGVLPPVNNMVKEAELADLYWQRYPDIAESGIWGRKSRLGVLGPRDHYFYVGRWQGRVWGMPGKN